MQYIHIPFSAFIINSPCIAKNLGTEPALHSQITLEHRTSPAFSKHLAFTMSKLAFSFNHLSVPWPHLVRWPYQVNPKQLILCCLSHRVKIWGGGVTMTPPPNFRGLFCHFWESFSDSQCSYFVTQLTALPYYQWFFVDLIFKLVHFF